MSNKQLIDDWLNNQPIEESILTFMIILWNKNNDTGSYLLLLSFLILILETNFKQKSGFSVQ